MWQVEKRQFVRVVEKHHHQLPQMGWSGTFARPSRLLSLTWLDGNNGNAGSACFTTEVSLEASPMQEQFKELGMLVYQSGE